MATFKVGQRVKRVRLHEWAIPIGSEGTVIRGVYSACVGEAIDIAWDDPSLERIGVSPSTLEPITDPGADAFIERIKKLKPYDEPTVEPRKTTVKELVDNAMRLLNGDAPCWPSHE